MTTPAYELTDADVIKRREGMFPRKIKTVLAGGLVRADQAQSGPPLPTTGIIYPRPRNAFSG